MSLALAALLMSPWSPGATALVLVVLSYLLGALPIGFLLAKHLKGIDLRETGSGNIGSTNAMRALGRSWGLVAFLLDVGKGWLPVFVLAPLAASPADAGGLGEPILRLAYGTAAVLGHCFPIYLRFRGGKGVATGCGAVIAVDPLIFLGGGVVWLVTLKLKRFVGLASMLMGASFPLLAWLRRPQDIPFLIGCTLLMLLIFARHRTNITRMLDGNEPRIGRKPPAPGSSHG